MRRHLWQYSSPEPIRRQFFDFDITLQLNETSLASMRITQTSSANLSAVNGGATVSFFENPPNTIVFNGGVCPTP